MRSTLLAGLLLATAPTVHAQGTAAGGDTQVVVPQVERRDIRLPHFPSNDFAFGLFAGTYDTQNFGASAVAGVRLGYHVTEDVFVEGTLAQTRVSDANFRQLLPGGVFASSQETLRYYALSAGYNLLPGEVFFGSRVAKASAFYVIGGIGSTDFVGQTRQTLHLGFGTRLLFNDRFAVQADVRDHVFSLDLLGKRQSTQNLEVTLGMTVFF